MAASFPVSTVFSAVDRFTPVLKKIGGATASFTKKASAGFTRVQRSVDKLTPSIGGLGRQMIAFASAGVFIAGISSAVNIVKDFEQANADLSAVMSTGTQKDFQLLTADAKRLGGITAKSATEVVGLQEALARLGFERPEIINMTKGIIAGSIAMNAELSETAELTGAVVRTFKGFSSLDTPTILDQMTLATQKTALNFDKLQTALPIVSGAASAAGIPFTKLLSLLGKLSDSGIDASSSANSLKNIFIQSKAAGDDYEQILARIQKNQDQLTASADAFGVRASVSGIILSNLSAETAILDNALIGAANAMEGQGVAQIAADKRLNTTTGSLTLLSSAYEALILDIDNGTGAMGAFRSIIDFVTKNLSTIAVTIGTVVGAIVALKVITGTITALTWLWNVAAGVSAVVQGKTMFAVRGNMVAIAAFKVVTAAVTAAQWLWNAAMLANPIGLIIIGVVAMIALITAVIVKWEQWGAAVSLFLGPIGILISMFMSLRKHWDSVTEAFTAGGILEGFKRIGVVLLDSVLFPIQQLLGLLSNIPGIDLTGGVDFVKDIRAKLDLDTESTSEETAPAINNTVEIETQRTIREETREKNLLDININNDSNSSLGFNKIGNFNGVDISSVL